MKKVQYVQALAPIGLTETAASGPDASGIPAFVRIVTRIGVGMNSCARFTVFAGMFAIAVAVPTASALADPVTNGGELLSLEDPDRDGLPNGVEYLKRTDPFHPDSDRDGFDDGLEVTAGTDPLDFDESIQEKSKVAIEMFPIAGNRVGILFLTYAYRGFGALDQYRILAGRREELTTRTEDIYDRGTLLQADNARMLSIAMVMDLDDVRDRVTIVAELMDRGFLHSATRAFGFHDGEFYIESYEETPTGLLLGSYSFGQTVEFETVPGLGGEWGNGGSSNDQGRAGDGDKYLADRIFTETIVRVRRKGMIVDTVIGNDCIDDPDERCPKTMSTIGEVRMGPSR